METDEEEFQRHPITEMMLFAAFFIVVISSFIAWIICLAVKWFGI